MKIEISGIQKTIKGNQVLNNVSCIMESGRVYGIYGRNGSGKTMLMRCVLGLIKADGGTINIDRQMIGKDIDFPQSVGAIIEMPGFFNYATGYENLKLLAEIKGKTQPNQIKDAIKMVGLNPEDKRIVAKYSLGMKQRLAIAQAIMEEPKLLVLDEPTNALDEEGIKIFREIIENEKKKGTLIIIASHNKEDIDILSDIKIKMDAGRIVQMEINDKKGKEYYD